jgi:CheY-like chemotaxis protein
MPTPRILIADDQPDVLNALRLLLKGQGYETEGVASPAELLLAVEAREFDLLLMDLNYARDTTSGREGLDLLSHLREIADAPAIVVRITETSPCSFTSRSGRSPRRGPSSKGFCPRASRSGRVTTSQAPGSRR